MNKINPEINSEEYLNFVRSIPELQKKLLEASQSFKRPEKYWENKAANTIQTTWRRIRIKKMRKPDPDAEFFGSQQWSWKICESDSDKFNWILSQPINKIRDPIVKELRLQIEYYEGFLFDDEDVKLSSSQKKIYYNDLKKLSALLRQLITHKLIFEYSKSNSSDSEMLVAHRELNKIKRTAKLYCFL